MAHPHLRVAAGAPAISSFPLRPTRPAVVEAPLPGQTLRLGRASEHGCARIVFAGAPDGGQPPTQPSAQCNWRVMDAACVTDRSGTQPEQGTKRPSVTSTSSLARHVYHRIARRVLHQGAMRCFRICAAIAFAQTEPETRHDADIGKDLKCGHNASMDRRPCAQSCKGMQASKRIELPTKNFTGHGLPPLPSSASAR